MPAARRTLAAAALILLAGCAVPPIDRELLHAQRVPVRVEGARGPLTHARSEQLLDELRRKSPATGILDRHVAVEEALAGRPLTAGNRATLLEDGPRVYGAMLAAIRGARHHVHMEMYIFEDDEVGQRFADALVERRRAGVQVRLIYDAVGSMGTPREFFQRLADADVEVVEFNPVTPAALLARGAALNRRNHRKLLVVDGRTAFLGGINISDVYTSGSSGGRPAKGPRAPWRDTQVRIEGPAVADFQRSFLELWARVLKQPVPEDPAYLPRLAPQGPHLVRAVEGWTGDGLNPLYVTLISAIESAETEVRITMAYFVPHEALREALKAAARRGVKVRLLLPGHSDHWLVRHAGRSYYDELLAAGVVIHERGARLLHSKTATVDGVWSTVGSTNLDWRSLLHNEEINAVVLGTGFAAELDASFDRDLAHSREITLAAWRERSIGERLREAAARAWARLL